MRRLLILLGILLLVAPLLAQTSALSPFYLSTSGGGAPSGYTDNFNRQDATDLGASWTQSYGTNEIFSQAVQGSGGEGNEAYYSAGTFANNQYSQVKLSLIGTTGYRAIGVIARAATGARTFYYAVYEPYDGHVYTGKYVGGAPHNYEWDEGAIVFSLNDVLRLEVTGQNASIYLSVKKNGTEVANRHDDNPNSLGYINSGKAGISCYGDLGASRVDDWAGGDL